MTFPVEEQDGLGLPEVPAVAESGNLIPPARVSGGRARNKAPLPRVSGGRVRNPAAKEDGQQEKFTYSVLALDPTFDPATIDTMWVQWVKYATPELWSQLDQDAARAINQTSPDYIYLKSVAERNGDNLLGPIFESIADAVLTRRGQIIRPQQLIANEQMFRGTWEAGHAPTVLPGFPGRETPEIGWRGAAPTQQVWSAETLEQYGGNIEKMWDVIGANAEIHALGRSGMYAWDGANNLAVQVTDEHGKVYTVGISLPDHAQIRNSYDAIQSYYYAVAKTNGYTISGGSDEIPGEKTVFGRAFEFIGDIERAAESTAPGLVIPVARFANYWANKINGGEAVWETPTEQKLRQFEEGDVTPYLVTKEESRQAIIASVFHQAALLHVGDSLTVNAEVLAAGEQFIAEEGEESIAVAAEDLSTSTNEQVVESMRRDIEAGTEVGYWIEDNLLDPAVTVAIAWDQFVHHMGIQALDAIGDTAQGVGLVTGLISHDDSLEGFELFKSAYDAQTEEYLSDYLGVEGTAAAWLNLGASVLFDPLTYIIPGARTSARWMTRVITDPALTWQYLKTPALRSLSRQVSKGKFGAAAVLSAGMGDSASVSALFRIAKEGGTIEDVLAVVSRELPANGGTWLPQTAQRVTTRHQVNGFARIFENWKKWGSANDDDFATFMTDMLARAPRSRRLSVDQQFLDGAIDMIRMRFPNNGEKFYEWVETAVRHWDEYAGGSARRTVALENQLEGIRRSIVGISTLPSDVSKFPGIPRTLQRLTDKIDDVARRLEAGVDDAEALTKELADLRSQVRSYKRVASISGPEWDAYRARVHQLHGELADLTTEVKVLARPGHPASLNKFWSDFFEGWGDDLGLERLADGTVDWSPVVGRSGSTGAASRAKDSAVFGGKDASSVDAIGMFDRAIEYLAPAAPLEIIAFRSMPKGAVWDGVRAFVDHQIAQGVMNTVQAIFSYSVLMNPMTALRANLDETLRFLVDTGQWKTFGKTFRALIPFTDEAVSSHARAWARMWADPISAGLRPYDIIAPKAPGHPAAMERWVNGHLLQDDAFRHYAQAVRTGDRTAFNTWWDEIGARYRKQEAISLPDPVSGELIRTTLDADLAYKIIDESFDRWLGGTVKNGGLKLRELVLDAATTPGGRVGSANNLAPFRKYATPVVGQPQSQTAIARRIMEGLYGSPQRRRGAFFFDHYFEQAKGIYDEAVKNGSIRLIDEDYLISKGLAANVDEAAIMMTEGMRNPHVLREINSTHGLYLASQLDDHASQYAAKAADGLMYQIGAVSVAGRKVQRFMPFARAQTDFLDWWFRKLTEPLQFKIPFTSKIMTPTVAGRAIPMNVRMQSRLGHMMAAFERELADDERVDPWSPTHMTETFSFIPSRWDDTWTTNIVPGQAPWVTWLLAMPNPNDPGWQDNFRAIVDNLLPSMMYVAGEQADFGDFGEYVAAKSGRSLPMIAYTLGRLMDGITGREWGSGVPYANVFRPALGLDELPVGMHDFAINAAGEWFTAENENGLKNVWAIVPTPDPTLPGLFDEAMAEINAQAFQDASLDEAGDRAARMWKYPGGIGSDRAYARHFAGLVEERERLLALGQISQAKFDELEIVVEDLDAFLAGDENVDVTRIWPLIDTANDILWEHVDDDTRDALVVRHPEMALNMVSRSECNLVNGVAVGAPEGVCEGTRFVGLTGEDGIALRKQGYDEGWLVHRDTIDMEQEAALDVHRAGNRLLSTHWEQMFGENYGKPSKAEAGAPVVLDKSMYQVETWESMGLVIPDEFVDLSGRITMTRMDLYTLFHDKKAQLVTEGFSKKPGETTLNLITDSKGLTAEMYPQVLDAFDWPAETFDALPPSHFGKGLVDDYAEALSIGRKDYGFESAQDWPENIRESFRNRFRVAIVINPNFTSEMYNNEYGWSLGSLDWEALIPSSIADFERRFKFTSDQVIVTDGDTLDVQTADGYVRFRLLGINTPEEEDEDYDLSRQYLQELINAGEQIEVGIFAPGRYGRLQTFYQRGDEGAGEPVIVEQNRIYAWLAVDGVIIAFEDEFSSENVRGTRIGGEARPLLPILEAGRSG